MGNLGPTLCSRDFPLSEARAGTYACVRLDATGDDSIRMKRLGICESRSLEIVNRGDPMIVKVCGAQIGISRQLARLITVRQLKPDTLRGTG